jgi:uncharacterized RmlC-like cupin family protein
VINKVAEKKYQRYVKQLSFKDDGPGFYRQGTEISSEFLGLDVSIRYGTYWVAGRIGKEPYQPHVHDFDQVLLWMGTDAADIGDLGAEVELCIGEEMEKHMITTTTAVSIPKGLPHLPASITRMDKRFILFSVSMAAELTSTPVPSDKSPAEPAGWQSKYRDKVLHVPYTRKGAWSYGAQNPDDSGGALAVIRGADFNYVIMTETLKKAPYRFGPIPDKPHTHPKPEILIFMGIDCNDLSELGGEVEIALGDEMERYVFNTPTVVYCPADLPHCPLTITKVDKPFLLTDVRPFGIGDPIPVQA